jgi:hypothetical protein
MHSREVAIVVGEYDPVIGCVAGTVGLEIVAECPSLTGHGRPRRRVVGRPPGAYRGHELAALVPGGASVNEARVAGVNGGSRPGTAA